MSLVRTARLIAGAGALAVCAAAAGQGALLQHDPFVRPAIGGFGPPRNPAAAAPRPAAPGEPRPRFQLNAVLAAGSNSIANVDGVMVRVGESVQGYRLVAVQDRSAVFEKNNARHTLTLQGGAKGEAAPRMNQDEAR
jgi:hypothetical protein